LDHWSAFSIQNGGIYGKRWDWFLDFPLHILTLVEVVPEFSLNILPLLGLVPGFSPTDITSRW
jgi:hypothetical protein